MAEDKQKIIPLLTRGFLSRWRRGEKPTQDLPAPVEFPDGPPSYSIRRPDYEREDVTVGIVHLGVGKFFQSHLAVYIDDLLAEYEKRNREVLPWGICGVNIRSAEKIKALEFQDGLYTVFSHSGGVPEYRIIGSMPETMHAKETPQAVVDKMALESTKVVSLTVYKEGYYCEGHENILNQEHSDISDDLNPNTTPSTALYYIVHALEKRKKEGIKPFTVLSCDNYVGNGKLAETAVLQYARMLGKEDLATWIEDNVAFPNTMVDRVTSGSCQHNDKDPLRDAVERAFGNEAHDTCPVKAEAVKHFIIEDKFCNDFPDLTAVGAEIVQDVTPFELSKIRMLNGSHRVIGCMASLCGEPFVHKFMERPFATDYISALMDEMIPALPAVDGVNYTKYRNKIIQRFSDDHMADVTCRLTTQGSSKIGQRLLDPIKDNLNDITGHLKEGRSIRLLAFGVAAWMVFSAGKDENNQSISFEDTRRKALEALAKSGDNSPWILLSDPIFSDLVSSKTFIREIRRAFSTIYEKGAMGAMEAYVVESLDPPQEVAYPLVAEKMASQFVHRR